MKKNLISTILTAMVLISCNESSKSKLIYESCRYGYWSALVDVHTSLGYKNTKEINKHEVEGMIYKNCKKVVR